jgi:cyclopropane-fatty-acyl-phospholipid synthase
MPSHDLLERFGDETQVIDRWAVSGTHYARTLKAWLARLDARSAQALAVLTAEMPPPEASRLLATWRLFLISTAEVWGFRGGDEWMVSHYLLEPSGRA